MDNNISDLKMRVLADKTPTQQQDIEFSEHLAPPCYTEGGCAWCRACEMDLDDDFFPESTVQFNEDENEEAPF